MTGTVELARSLAESIRTDAAFQKTAQATYGKTCLVEVGFDRRRVEWTNACPFCVVTAGSANYAGGFPSVEHTIGVVFGVNDKGFTSELAGYEYLGEKAWPSALDAIIRAVEMLPGLSIGEMSIEFNQESFPLLYLNAAITITESLPIGRRT